MSTRNIYLIIIVAVVVVAGVAAALMLTPGGFGGANAQTITLVMRDNKFNYTNPKFTVQKGVVKFTLINNEVILAHNFVIPEIPGASIPINPGGNRELTVTFPTAGTYHYLCSLHPAMNSTITVTG